MCVNRPIPTTIKNYLHYMFISMGKKVAWKRGWLTKRVFIFLVVIAIVGGYYAYLSTKKPQEQIPQWGQENTIQIYYMFTGYEALLWREWDILKQFSFNPEKILSWVKINYIDPTNKPENQSFALVLSVINWSWEEVHSIRWQLWNVFWVSFPESHVVSYDTSDVSILWKLPNKIWYPEDILAVTVTDTQTHQEKAIPFDQDKREFTYTDIENKNMGYLFRAYTKDRVFHSYIDLTLTQTTETNTGDILVSSWQTSSIAPYESTAISKQEACQKIDGMHPIHLQAQWPNMKTETWNFAKTNNSLVYAVGAGEQPSECWMQEYSFFTYNCATEKTTELYNTIINQDEGRSSCAFVSIFANNTHILYDAYPYEWYPTTTLFDINKKTKSSIDIFEQENGSYIYKNIDKLLEKTEQLEREYNKGKTIKDSSDRPWKQRSISSCSSITNCTIYYSVYLDWQVKIDYTGATVDLVNKVISLQ